MIRSTHHRIGANNKYMYNVTIKKIKKIRYLLEPHILQDVKNEEFNVEKTKSLGLRGFFFIIATYL